MQNIHGLAKNLRRNLTDSERVLWNCLRTERFKGLTFRRQEPIGRYIVDFVCYENGLIIEVDGGQHAGDMDKDGRRDEWLRGEGFKILRFWNNDVLTNIEGVAEMIKQNLTPSPDPSHRGRGRNRKP